jgi:HEAT repeat protein
MNAVELERYRQQLYNHTPLIGGWLRRRAAETLRRDGTPEARQMLVEAVIYSGDRSVQDTALAVLVRHSHSRQVLEALAMVYASSDSKHVRSTALQALRESIRYYNVHALCEVWIATRNRDLASLLLEYGEKELIPSTVKVLAALQVERLDIVSRSRGVVIPLLQACDDVDPVIAERAQQVLHQLTDQVEIIKSLVQVCEGDNPAVKMRARQALMTLKTEESQEALCQFAVDDIGSVAREIAVAAGYVPQDEQQRALFFFITEQWDRYELLDFDRQFLRTVYALADDKLRQRIRERLRTAGRADFLTIIAGEDYRERIPEMTPSEIDLLTQTLIANHKWKELWDLAFAVPLVGSVRIVTILAGAEWRPGNGDERSTFDELVSLINQGLEADEQEIKNLFSPAIPQANIRTNGRINDIAFSPASPTIAIGTGTRRLALWNYQQARLERIIRGFSHSIGHVAFNDRNVLFCSEQTATGVWTKQCGIYGWNDAWNDEEPFQVGQHRGSVSAIALVNDEQILSAGNVDPELVLWDVPNRRNIARRTYNSWVRAISVSPSGQQAVLLRQGVRGFDLVTLKNLAPIAHGRSKKGIPRCATFSNDGQAVVVGKFNGNVAVYRQEKEYRFVQERELLTQHRGRVQDVKTLCTHPVVITSGDDGSIRFVNLENRFLVGEVQASFGRATSLHISPDGTFMAVGYSQSGSTKSEVSLWDLRGVLARLALVRPFASATSFVLRDIQASLKNQDLSPHARLALEYAECILQHRFQYDIELGAAPTIMAGEFDIEID